MKRIICFALVIVMLFAFASCSNGGIEFSYQGGKLINKETKEQYTPSPLGYEPYGVGERIGTFSKNFGIYEIVGEDGVAFSTEDWLTEEYSGNATAFFYGKNADFAPFEEMDIDICYICQEDVSVVSLASIDDGDTLSTLKEIALGEGSALLPLTDIKENYTLKFYSEEHPQYFYSVNYAVCESGNYIYDMEDTMATDVGTLLDSYIGSAE